jgi:hypothetical protein
MSRAGRLPLGFLGMVALVAVVEWRIGDHAGNLADVAASNWRYSRELAGRIDARTDVLVLGDSLNKFGVLPRLLEQGTNARALNLAVCSGHMPASYYLLRRALEAGARPRAVILDCMDKPIDPSERDLRSPALVDNMRNWPELLNPAECLDLGWEAGDGSAAGEMLLARLMPSLRCRDQVREVVAARLKDQPWTRDEELKLVHRNWDHNGGAFVVPDVEASDPDLASAAPAPVSGWCAHRPTIPVALGPDGKPDPDRWRPNRLTMAYTERLLSLARDRDIAVYWLLPPHRAKHQAQRERDGIDRYTERLAGGFLARYPNLTILDARHSGYPDDAFYDVVHLDRLGSTALTADLAEILAGRGLAADVTRERWVRLPEFRAPGVSALVEDLVETRVALNAEEEQLAEKPADAPSAVR